MGSQKEILGEQPVRYHRAAVKLEGLHHITAITADAPGNVDFYARVLGLRLVKKTVNFDAPDVYHLYYGDEAGTPGSILTFFEFPGAARGRAGAGMVHKIEWRVADEEALAFWADRLAAEGVRTDAAGRMLHFTGPEGLEHTLMTTTVADAPLRARAQDIPPQHALQGFQGVRAFARDPAASAPLLEALGMQAGAKGRWDASGTRRHGHLHLGLAPDEQTHPSIQGAGTVHHIAWSVADDGELESFQARVARAGARPTPIIDRQYFHSVYFREPNGVLFELATRDIGFDVDEPAESLGEALKLPPQHESLRETLEHSLTPLPDPR